ncbi:hypothetical protein ACW9HQ_52855, partial [Nocardia gipuzkoensis]
LAVFDPTASDTGYTEDTYRDLLRDSDSAMYSAKHRGGNTVVITDRRTPEPAVDAADDQPTEMATPRPH